MANKIIISAFLLLMYSVQDLSSQSRFHIELDYHYMVGLAEKGEIVDYNRDLFQLYGNSLHISGIYKLSDAFSTGVGIGADRYESPGYNTFPVFATLQYFPLQTIPSGYVYTDVGYALNRSTTIPGFLCNLGIGYKHMFRKHFGLKAQLGYNYKHLKNSTLFLDDNQFYSTYRHSINIGLGIIF